MDATQDAAQERSEDARFDDVIVEEAELRASQRRNARRFSWGVAWVVPVLSLIVGIWLTSARTIEQLNDLGDGTFDVTLFVVWPAGLVLLGVGVLGVVATAIATAVLSTDR
ncbi:hypothetical protein [Microbacterium saperdae]|uniref:Uncharacterized protein n=1 Tax=Microbacterium saperdae TaxID=69368 RepID=A0A543BB65_9MICO|nr:hypothetical protein [Microbacterium saperdae]TQL82091.1 hypothetical protein FB560_3573 [Microbacterium saperdae]GGM37146.1 hypothetical protein GCM10010489_05100 [Microbacterium saperdae]